MNIVLLGAPGAGKGTQAAFITKALNIPAISTGNLLRDAIARGTAEGKLAKGYMDEGHLVPDELIFTIIREFIQKPECRRGMVFDGVPRNLAQAEALEDIAKIDMALLLDVDDETIINRLSGRRMCPDCQATYHMEDKPPLVEGICDICDTALITRSDDSPEVVRERLAVYHQETEPIIDFYRRKGLLVSVKSQKEVADTTALVAAAIGVKA